MERAIKEANAAPKRMDAWLIFMAPIVTVGGFFLYLRDSARDGNTRINQIEQRLNQDEANQRATMDLLHSLDKSLAVMSKSSDFMEGWIRGTIGPDGKPIAKPQDR